MVRTEPEAAVKTKPKKYYIIRGNSMIASVSTSRRGESDGADGVRNNNGWGRSRNQQTSYNSIEDEALRKYDSTYISQELFVSP